MPISPLSYAWRGMPSVAVAKMASVASGVAGCFPGRPRDLNGSWWKVGGVGLSVKRRNVWMFWVSSTTEKQTLLYLTF